MGQDNIIHKIDTFISKKSNILSNSRIKTYKKTRDYVLESNASNLHELFNYLVSTGLSNSTALQYVKAFKKSAGLSQEISSLSREIRIVNNTEKIFFKDEEIKKIYNHRTDSSSLGKIRDLFVFCSYTGLRHSDTQRITKDNVSVVDMKGTSVTVLKYDALKNGSFNTVPLNNTCLEIISRWTKDDKILPRLSNSACNRYLTELLEEIGFDEKVKSVWYSGNNKHERFITKAKATTFHSSRHSFSFLLLQKMNMKQVSDMMGVSIATLQNWYSHSDVENRSLKALEILNN
jgi:integrase